jgi:hypothetical protein
MFFYGEGKRSFATVLFLDHICCKGLIVWNKSAFFTREPKTYAIGNTQPHHIEPMKVLPEHGVLTWLSKSASYLFTAFEMPVEESPRVPQKRPRTVASAATTTNDTMLLETKTGTTTTSTGVSAKKDEPSLPGLTLVDDDDILN